jgi:hypothetical protein
MLHNSITDRGKATPSANGTQSDTGNQLSSTLGSLLQDLQRNGFGSENLELADKSEYLLRDGRRLRLELVRSPEYQQGLHPETDTFPASEESHPNGKEQEPNETEIATRPDRAISSAASGFAVNLRKTNNSMENIERSDGKPSQVACSTRVCLHTNGDCEKKSPISKEGTEVVSGHNAWSMENRASIAGDTSLQDPQSMDHEHAYVCRASNAQASTSGKSSSSSISHVLQQVSSANGPSRSSTVSEDSRVEESERPWEKMIVDTYVRAP